MCPSPDTRSPTASPRTSAPAATISPQYSWPTCIGTGMVRLAQASHWKMWMSVPQIAVLRIRISTSFGPGSGFGSSPSQMPGSGRDLINAFMPPSLADDAQFPSRLAERFDGALEHRARVAGAHLRADARLAHRHDGIGEADHVDAEREQPVRHASRQHRVAEHDGDDRVLARHQRETERRHAGVEPRRVVGEPAAWPAGGLEQVEHGERGRSD